MNLYRFLNTQRHYKFSTLNLQPELSLEDVQTLHKLQSDFERDSGNVKAAYELFRVSIYKDNVTRNLTGMESTSQCLDYTINMSWHTQVLEMTIVKR